MIVGICGLGYSGSGAITALLKEFNETQVFDEFEFVFSYIPDGLEDLEYHLMNHCSRYYDSDMAIRRFKHYIRFANTKRSALRKATGNKIVELTDDYLDKITQVKWKGFWSADMTHTDWLKRLVSIRVMMRVNKLIFKMTKKNPTIIPNRDMYMSIRPENFYMHSKQYISDILQLMGQDTSKITVLDQPFSGDEPEKSFKFFESPKALVIDRDPRDLYLVSKRIGSIVGRFMPTDDVETFVEYYKLIRKNTKVNENNETVLRLNFEDVIYEYDRTIATIKDFIGIGDHVRKKQYFQPEVSINNTQLFLKFKDMQDDIKYIEDNLKEYLYPFEKYGPINHKGKSF